MKIIYILCKLDSETKETTCNLHCNVYFETEATARKYVRKYKLKDRVSIDALRLQPDDNTL